MEKWRGGRERERDRANRYTEKGVIGEKEWRERGREGERGKGGGREEGRESGRKSEKANRYRERCDREGGMEREGRRERWGKRVKGKGVIERDR